MTKQKIKPGSIKIKTIALSLSDSNFTPLHQAGVAGMWMFLDAIAPQNGDLVYWQLTAPGTIVLTWGCTDWEAVQWLCKQAFKLNEGIIHLTGTGQSPAQKLITHLGMRNTFLGGSHSVGSSLDKSKITFEVGENISVDCSKIHQYRHQTISTPKKEKADEDTTEPTICKDTFTSSGYFKDEISIMRWLYPGCTTTHDAYNDKGKFKETPEGFLALLFAPIACSYFKIKSKEGTWKKDGIENSRNEFAVVIPRVEDIPGFVKCHSRFSRLPYQGFHVAGAVTAGLNHLGAIAAANKTLQSTQIKQCQVLVFGKVPWGQQQKVLTESREISIPEDKAKHIFRWLNTYCKSRVIQPKKGDKKPYVQVDNGNEFFANNLISDRPWHADFYQLAKRLKSLGQQFNFTNLKAMTYENLDTIDQGKLIFFSAMQWEIYRRINNEVKKDRNRRTYHEIVKKVLSDTTYHFKSVFSPEMLRDKVRIFMGYSSHLDRTNPFVKQDYQTFYQMQNDVSGCLDMIALAVSAYEHPLTGNHAEAKLAELRDRSVISSETYQELMSRRENLIKLSQDKANTESSEEE